MRFKIEVILALAFGGLALIGLILPILGWIFLGVAALLSLHLFSHFVLGLYRRRRRTIKAMLGPTSTVRKTLTRPRNGRHIRILGYTASAVVEEPVTVELYFGTGAQYHTFPGSQIDMFVLRKDSPNYTVSFPEMEQPIGMVDHVVSIRTDRNVGDKVNVTIRHREE